MNKKYILIFILLLIFVSCSASIIAPSNNDSNSGSGTEEGGGTEKPDIPWTEIEPPMPILDEEAMKYGVDISQEDNLIKEQIKSKMQQYYSDHRKHKVIFIGKAKENYKVSQSLAKLISEVANEIYAYDITIDISKIYFYDRRIKYGMFQRGVGNGWLNLSFIFPENIIRIIEGNAFSFLNNSLREINIPDSVIRIESAAFQADQELAKITFTENSKLEYIGSLAFSYAIVKEILIPASVTSIGRSAFGNHVTTVTYLGTKPNTIMNNKDVFENCVNLKTLIVPNAENIDDPIWKTFLGGKFSEVRK